MCLKELKEEDFVMMDIARRRVVSNQTTFSHVNREGRTLFCKQKLTWTVFENWSRVIFSDETKMMLGNNN